MNISSFYISKKDKIKNKIMLLFILSILTYFILFSKLNFKIVSDITDIFIYILIPSLFPFILFSNILISSGYFNLISESFLAKMLQNFFKTSKHGASCIIFGYLFGYPNGARYVNGLYEKNMISYKEAEYLTLFINNGSPAYILSSIGIGMFNNVKIGTLLLLSHMLSSLIIGKFYSYKYSKYIKNNNNDVDHSKYKFSFDILYSSINKTFGILGLIFGFMIISVIFQNYVITFIKYVIPINSLIESISLLIVETTSGLKLLLNNHFNLHSTLIYISFFLGFSSFSILLQIFACIYKSKIKFKILFKGKLLHGILSFIITYILVNIPFIYERINIGLKANLNFDNMFSNLYDTSSLLTTNLLLLIATIIIIFLISKKKRLSKLLNRLKGG